MPSLDPISEFRTAWLPHVSDEGLARITELLDRASPLLIHGAFTKAIPMGCLATHIAWNDCRTCHLEHEAGVMWLSKVASLNPATSSLVQAWDEGGVSNFALRSALLAECWAERDHRNGITTRESEEQTCPC